MTKNPPILEAAQLQQLISESELPYVVDFWAPWCPPCRRLAPTLEQLAQEFDGRLVVLKVNIEDDRQVTERFEIRSIPTLLFFRQGRLVNRHSGALTYVELKRLFEQLLAG